MGDRKRPSSEGGAPPSQQWRPPTAGERVATVLPPDAPPHDPVAVDPAVVGPAMEASILAVLPEVVEVVLRTSVSASTEFRTVVEAAVEEAVRRQLPAIVDERLAAIRGADPKAGGR